MLRGCQMRISSCSVKHFNGHGRAPCPTSFQIEPSRCRSLTTMLTMGRRSRSRVFDSIAGLRREVVMALGSLLYTALLVTGLALPAEAAGVDHTCGSTIFAYDGPVDVAQSCAVERVGSAAPIVRVEGAAVLAERSSGHAHRWSADPVAPSTAPTIKPGASGGATAGKRFPESVRRQALDENPSTCMYCRMESVSPQVDHAIPRERGGNATLPNAQTTCPHCNASKGARDFPVNPPPGYRGPWPPSWWPS